MSKVNNSVRLYGRVGGDPKIVEAGGKPCANVSLAVTDNYKDKNGNWANATTWVPLIAWGNIVTVFEKRVHKGDEILVEGYLRSREYTDKNENRRSILEVCVEGIKVLRESNSNVEAAVDDDDLPI